jgi:hypothetical protein
MRAHHVRDSMVGDYQKDDQTHQGVDGATSKRKVSGSQQFCIHAFLVAECFNHEFLSRDYLM